MNSLLTRSINSTALKGRKAIVFGASSGLGYASAYTLADMGADVVMLARNSEKLEDKAEQIRKITSVKIITEAQDLTDIKGMAVVLKTHEDCDILVTNCGGPPVSNFESFSLDDWEAAWQGQLRSAVQACQALVPKMAAKHWGRVIMLASVTIAHPMKGFALSNSIRPGLTGLAATLSQEYAASGVTANVVCPGITATERINKLVDENVSADCDRDKILQQWVENIPVKRLADAEEIAALTGFLASDAAAFITGQSLLIDGGQSVAG